MWTLRKKCLIIVGMTIELFEALSLLKDTLKHDKRFILLDEIEKELENDDEVKIKAYQVDVASIAYNDILRLVTGG